MSEAQLIWLPTAAGMPPLSSAGFSLARGEVVSDPVGVLARLQLARALSLAGDKPAARAAYRDFLTLWKDADPDIPLLKNALAEYAALR
jgi:hypothetical protein